MTKFLKHNEVKKDLVDYKLLRNMWGIHVSKVEDPYSTHSPYLTTAEMNAFNDRFIFHLYDS